MKQNKNKSKYKLSKALLFLLSLYIISIVWSTVSQNVNIFIGSLIPPLFLAVYYIYTDYSNK